MSEPLISVIMPVHNAAGSLDRALTSVLEQTVADFELILVDDCSTDESTDILENYRELDGRVRFFSTARNSGPGAARNVGLKNSRGRYIAFLDADDFWFKDKLERQVRSFEDDNVVLSYTTVILLNAQGDILGIVNSRKRLHLLDMYVSNRVTMSSAMIRRDLTGAEEMPEMRNREDYAYWMSLLKRNSGYIAGAPQALCGYVNMPGSASSNALRNVVDTYRMYVSEVGVHPLLATALVIVFAYFKCCKELTARLRWMCMPKFAKEKLRNAVAVHWNWDQRARKL